MERIRIFRGSPALAKFLLGFGCFLTLFGLVVTVKLIIDGFDTHFPSGHWSFVLFTFQGILFIIMGWSYLKSRKYFIEWDDKEIRYLLPYTKKTESVKIDDIRSVNTRLFEIELKLINGWKTVNLDNLEFEDIKKIKERFSSLGQTNK